MTGRKKIVAMIGSFHGRSMGSLAITYNEHYRKPFEPLPGEIIWTPMAMWQRWRRSSTTPLRPS